MPNKNILISIVILLLYLVGCDSTTEPLPIKPEPYVSLHIGDIRQYTDNNGLFVQSRIVDTTRRIDGQKVFVFEESQVSSDEIFKGTLYFYLDETFFIQTELDTVRSPQVNYLNPFSEQRVAKLYPIDKNYFLRNKGAASSQEIFFLTSIIDSIKTIYKTFKNVAEYNIISLYESLRGASYYAQGYGHIGSLFINNNDTLKIFSTYIKVSGKELGELNNVFSKKFQTLKKTNHTILLNY